MGAFNLNSEIGTADSADFTDFEEARLSGDNRTNFFVAKTSEVANRSLLNLRNLWLNPFSVFGYKVQTETVRLHRTAACELCVAYLNANGLKARAIVSNRFAVKYNGPQVI